MAFQRKENRRRLASRRHTPDFIEAGPWRPRSTRCRPARAGFTKSNSTATACKSISGMQRVKLFTRRGNDWTNRFRKIAADAWHVNAGSAIIDGEGRRASRKWAPRISQSCRTS